MAYVFNGRNLGHYFEHRTIGHGERLMIIFNHKSEEIKGIKEKRIRT